MGLHPLLLLRPRVRAVHDGVAQGRGAPVRPLRRRAGDVAPERVVGGASAAWSAAAAAAGVAVGGEMRV